MIAIDTTASYARTLGASPSSTVANTLNAVFGIAIVAPDDTVRYSGNAFYQYRYSHDLGDPAPDLTAIVRHEGGFTTSSSEHAFASHAVLSSAAFDLLPGETMAIFMSVGASANVINLLGLLALRDDRLRPHRAAVDATAHGRHARQSGPTGLGDGRA